jgi:hypothetical protein
MGFLRPKTPAQPPVIINPPPPSLEDTDMTADAKMRLNAKKSGRAGTRLVNAPVSSVVASASNKLLGQ